MVGFWGKCRPQCTGEMPTRGSPHNLAGTAFNNIWKAQMYDLKTWGSGHCHTYNPPEPSLPGTAGLLYALLGDAEPMEATATDASFRGLTIYLHQRGMFWPGVTVAEKIWIDLNENVDVTFKVSEWTDLNSPAGACTEAINYSLTDCLMAYVEQTAGCKLDWFIQKKDQLDEKYCEGPKDIREYMKVLDSIDFENSQKIPLQTGQ